MNEDPTRLMSYGDEPPRRRREPNPPKGNLRLVVLIMGVIIFGLLIGLISSCGGGGTKTVTQTRTITEEIPAKEPQGKAAENEGEGEEPEEGEEAEEPEESAEEQELREIEEAEAAEAETGGIEELGEEEGGEIIEEFPEEEGEIFEEEGGGGVGAE
jgi:hypothetical protein